MKNTKNISEFIKNWGQTTEEICLCLGYDEETSDDLLMIDYFFNDNSWFPKSSSFYTKKYQKIANSLIN